MQGFFSCKTALICYTDSIYIKGEIVWPIVTVDPIVGTILIASIAPLREMKSSIPRVIPKKPVLSINLMQQAKGNPAAVLHPPAVLLPPATAAVSAAAW